MGLHHKHCQAGTPHQSCLYRKLAPAIYGIKIRSIKNSQKTFGGCLSPDKNLCKKKKLVFFTVWWDLCTLNLDRDRNLCKKKKLISYTVWWDFAVPILTVIEICAKRKSWSFFTLCGEILQFQSWPNLCKKKKVDHFYCVVRFVHCQSWPWQKSVQKEKVDLLHCVVRFCSSSLDLDRNLCKRKKLIFFFFTPCGVILQSKSWPWLKSVQKEKVDIFYTVWWDFALQMLTVTEICSKRKNSLLLYVVRFLHSQSWPWQKSVQTEKVDLLHCVVRFCSSNLDLQPVDFHSLFEHWWQRTVEQIKPISR